MTRRDMLRLMGLAWAMWAFPRSAEAAATVRYFSTTAAGDETGSSWANRAALFSAGNWSTVISGHDFATSALKCFIGPGSYTCSQSLTTTVITTDPTAQFPLFLCGCDSSGAALAIPDPDWVSPMPAWDDSTLPVIATTTNIATLNLTHCFTLLLKFTASGRNGGVIGTGIVGMYWTVVLNSTANSAAIAVTSAKAYGCVFTCTGSSYDTIVSVGGTPMTNCRVEGVTGSSGNRRGITSSAITTQLELVTVVNCGGEGIIGTSASTSQNLRVRRCTVANNGATGIKANSTAAQTEHHEVHGCMITGNGTAGIDGNSDAARFVITSTRLRDNTTNIQGIGDYPTDLSIYTTDSDDATEYVSTGANGDFRIKTSAAIWNQGYGAGDQAASGRRRIIGG